jgi:hypothetical protein
LALRPSSANVEVCKRNLLHASGDEPTLAPTLEGRGIGNQSAGG